MANNKSLNYRELNDLRGKKVWDSRYSCWVKIMHGGISCILYKDDNEDKGEIYRGDEEGRFFLQEIK